MAKLFTDWRSTAGRHATRPRLVIQAVLVLMVAIFVADLFLSGAVTLSALHAIPVLVSTLLGSRRFTLAVAGACCALVFLSLLGTDAAAVTALATRSVALFTILVVTNLGLLRMRVERELHETQRAATTTLESIADAVIRVDAEGRIRFINPVARKLTGWSEREALGRELESVLHVTAAENARPDLPPILDLEPRGREWQGRLHARDGRLIPVEVGRSPMADADEDEDLGEVIVFRDITERLEHLDAIKKLAYRDELTGLPNRTSLTDRLALELAHARRNDEVLALLFLDLDRFKEVNDRYGHHVGDGLLKEVATRLQGALRAGDTVARLGGDEFTVVLPAVSGPDEARRVAEKIRSALHEPARIEGHELLPGGSVGMALFPRDGDEPDVLLRRADQAMYRAKELGGGRVVVHGAPREESAPV